MSDYRYRESPGYRERGYGREDRWDDESGYDDELERRRRTELQSGRSGYRSRPYGREGRFERYEGERRGAYGGRGSWSDMGPTRGRTELEDEWERSPWGGGYRSEPYRGEDAYGRSGYYGRYAGRGPRGYRRSTERIREDVCELLTRHPDIDASEIEVKAEGRVVTLRGQVEDRFQKRLAEDVADSVSGVEDVRNELDVDKSLFEELKDAVTGSDDKEQQSRRKSARATTSRR